MPCRSVVTLCVAAPGVRAGCTRAVGPCAGPSATSSPPAWAATGTTRDRTDRTASSADRTEDTTDTIQASTSGRARYNYLLALKAVTDVWQGGYGGGRCGMGGGRCGQAASPASPVTLPAEIKFDGAAGQDEAEVKPSE